MPNSQQPALHELTTTLCAPNVVLSSPSGRITCGDATGAYRHDRRSLAQAEFAVPTADLVPVGSASSGAGRVRFQGVVREHGDTTPDPALHYVHDRVVTADSVRESWILRNTSGDTVRLTVTLRAATDLARMDQVKAGEEPALVDPSASERAATWEQDGCSVRLDLGEAAEEVSTADGLVTWAWHVELGSGQSRSFSFEVVQHEADRPGFLPVRPSPATKPSPAMPKPAG